MISWKHLLAACVVPSMVFCSAVQAEDAKPGQRPGGANREEMMKKVLAKFDKNGDGKLDDAEKAALKEQFGKGRPDGAGKPGGPGGFDREAMMKKAMEKFDKNGDGKLDDTEKAALKEAFAKMRAQGGGDGFRGRKPGGDGKPAAKPEKN